MTKLNKTDINAALNSLFLNSPDALAPITTIVLLDASGYELSSTDIDIPGNFTRPVNGQIQLVNNLDLGNIGGNIAHRVVLKRNSVVTIEVPVALTPGSNNVVLNQLDSTNGEPIILTNMKFQFKPFNDIKLSSSLLDMFMLTYFGFSKDQISLYGGLGFSENIYFLSGGSVVNSTLSVTAYTGDIPLEANHAISANSEPLWQKVITNTPLFQCLGNMVHLPYYLGEPAVATGVPTYIRIVKDEQTDGYYQNPRLCMQLEIGKHVNFQYDEMTNGVVNILDPFSIYVMN